MIQRKLKGSTFYYTLSPLTDPRKRTRKSLERLLKIFASLCAVLTVTTIYLLYPRKQPLEAFFSQARIVDLTHEFAPGQPHWPGAPDESREIVYWYSKNDSVHATKGYGFFIQYFCHVGQWGTHVDFPGHFFKNMRLSHDFHIKDMIMPLVVIDCSSQAAENPDYILQMQDVLDWERRHGPVPQGSFVAMRTDWSRRFKIPDDGAIANKDATGISHFPGWSMDTLSYLYEKRMVAANGHETTDTDGGIATSKYSSYALEAYVLQSNHIQVELLANLHSVPEAGAMIVVSFPKARGASGFPARVFAIVRP